MFGVRAKKTQVKVNIYKYNKSKYCDEGLYTLEYQVLYTPVNYKQTLLKNKKIESEFFCDPFSIFMSIQFLCPSN